MYQQPWNTRMFQPLASSSDIYIFLYEQYDRLSWIPDCSFFDLIMRKRCFWVPNSQTLSSRAEMSATHYISMNVIFVYSLLFQLNHLIQNPIWNYMILNCHLVRISCLQRMYSTYIPDASWKHWPDYFCCQHSFYVSLTILRSWRAEVRFAFFPSMLERQDGIFIPGRLSHVQRKRGHPDTANLYFLFVAMRDLVSSCFSGR